MAVETSLVGNKCLRLFPFHGCVFDVDVELAPAGACSCRSGLPDRIAAILLNLGDQARGASLADVRTVKPKNNKTQKKQNN
jgi:hypothetical protein